MKNKNERKSLYKIQQEFFRTQLILIITLALFLGAAGIIMNIYSENKRRDLNLQNVAETIAHSQVLTSGQNGTFDKSGSAVLIEYVDSLKGSLSDIDVISVVNSANIRLYHSNHELINTVYDGTVPVFEYGEKEFYAVNASGPSGTQRRAYAAVYDKDGNYFGFVMAITLMSSIRSEILRTLTVFFMITVFAIFIELLISMKLSDKIKERLMGYEPDTFSAMYKIRDNILESLDEGIIAVDSDARIQFANNAATDMLGIGNGESIAGKKLDEVYSGMRLAETLESGEKEFNFRLGNADILIDRLPVKEGNTVIGAVGILHNRAEYTKLQEDLTGTRYLVDSIRANNHDFTNKLHVILGLIQTEMYSEAASYIENITIVQREIISRIMNAVNDTTVAALLIGKTARASELNVKFVLREGCTYTKSDMPIPSETLVTVIGNLIDNALEAMNEADGGFSAQNELLFGIYSRHGALLITTDDTGTGIAEEDMERIFENGFSTKGTGRGTGLYQVKKLVEGLGGTITVESQKGVGTSFSVSIQKDGGVRNV